METFLSDARSTLIERALASAKGNQSHPARLLGTTPQNINKFLKTRSNHG
jgi:transcriptional regulator with GAF, ATPase, and Fis domain